MLRVAAAVRAIFRSLPCFPFYFIFFFNFIHFISGTTIANISICYLLSVVRPLFTSRAVDGQSDAQTCGSGRKRVDPDYGISVGRTHLIHLLARQ